MAETCRFYHWTLDYVLNMPARQFFLMHRQYEKLQAMEYMTMCDIAAIPMCSPKYFEEVRSRFERQLASQITSAPALNPLPEDRAFDAKSKAAKYAVMEMFASIKRH